MRFVERQYFRQVWVWLVLLGVSMAVALPAMTRPSAATIAALTGVTALVAMMAFARLEVAVTDDEIRIRFRPFHLRGRRIALADVVEARARTYSPIGEYGGWGIRLGGDGMAYNVAGSEGVQLVLADGSRILIGSQRSAELEAAITSSRPAPRS